MCSIEIERRVCRLGGSNNSLIVTHAEFSTRFDNYKERVCSIATMISEHTCTQNKYNRKTKINLRKCSHHPHMHIVKFGDNVIEWRGLIKLWRRDRRLSQNST